MLFDGIVRSTDAIVNDVRWHCAYKMGDIPGFESFGVDGCLTNFIIPVETACNGINSDIEIIYPVNTR